MKVRMISTAAGPDGVLDSGRSYDLPPARASELVNAGAAVYLPGQAVREDREKAVKKKAEPLGAGWYLRPNGEKVRGLDNVPEDER